ncbi:MAG: FumA C-terminus/TtdB family hydratase beta subunit [Advenella sp.]
MKTYYLTMPISDDQISQLRVGDEVYLSGVIYMARDAAHKRLITLLDQGKSLPVNLKGQVVFYGGPGPTKPDHVIGVVAPTSSYRMDPYTPKLFEYGVKAAIGKGNRSKEIRQACIDFNAVSFSAIGGISATLFACIRKADVVAYEDLKTEAIQRLEIENFPLLVTNDTCGGDLYEQEVQKYRKLLNA